MTEDDTTCVTCGKVAQYRFCSNECYLSYAPKRSGVDCAVCRYRGKDAPPGDGDTTRICEECRADPANRDWVTQSRLEAVGFNMDDFEAGSAADLKPRRDPFANKLAISIMALHCAGKSNRAVASELGCDRRHVDRTVAYWKIQRGEKLQIIKTLTKMKIKKAH